METTTQHSTIAKKYSISLTTDERRRLVAITKKGKESARKISRAHILLLADKGLCDEEIVNILHVSIPTVGRIRKRFCIEGITSALNEKPRPGARRKFKQENSTALGQLLNTPPPQGHGRWSLRLIADRLVEMNVVDSISHETVRNVLKNRAFSVNP
ncbi:MAG: helix-turn-helix domain-containing protein [Candidatus Kapabacteria bacterium]|nr:helix-turn-helix domain-containing protein [Candidatus Kapabacteria bacterium]